MEMTTKSSMRVKPLEDFLFDDTSIIIHFQEM